VVAFQVPVWCQGKDSLVGRLPRCRIERSARTATKLASCWSLELNLALNGRPSSRRKWCREIAPLSWSRGSGSGSTRRSGRHAVTVVRRLERDVFPWLGGRPIGDITAVELHRVEARGALRRHIGSSRSADKFFDTPLPRDGHHATLAQTFVAPCHPLEKLIMER
jgi:hypothetical protein